MIFVAVEIAIEKMMEHESDLSLEKAVEIVAWTHNSNVNRLGFTPLTLVTGKTVFFPGVSNGNVATESLTDSEAVRKIIERHAVTTKEFRQAEYVSKLRTAAKTRNSSFNNVKYKQGDRVFIQEMRQKRL